MFSDHLTKVTQVPYKALSLLGAGLVFIALLSAMVMVLQGQVQRAQVRNAQDSFEQNAIASCKQSKFGAVLDSCVQDARSAADLGRTQNTQGTLAIMARQADRFGMSATSSLRPVPDLMSATLVTR